MDNEATAGAEVTGADGAHPRADLPVYLFASEVAEGFAEAAMATTPRRNEIFDVAMWIGEHLLEVGEPGNWHAIDGGTLGQDLLDAPVDERAVYASTAATMLGWLSQTGEVDPRVLEKNIWDLAHAVRSCAQARRAVEPVLRVLRLVPRGVAGRMLSSTACGSRGSQSSAR